MLRPQSVVKPNRGVRELDRRADDIARTAKRGMEMVTMKAPRPAASSFAPLGAPTTHEEGGAVVDERQRRAIKLALRRRLALAYQLATSDAAALGGEFVTVLENIAMARSGGSSSLSSEFLHKRMNPVNLAIAYDALLFDATTRPSPEEALPEKLYKFDNQPEASEFPFIIAFTTNNDHRVGLVPFRPSNSGTPHVIYAEPSAKTLFLRFKPAGLMEDAGSVVGAENTVMDAWGEEIRAILRAAEIASRSPSAAKLVVGWSKELEYVWRGGEEPMTIQRLDLTATDPWIQFYDAAAWMPPPESSERRAPPPAAPAARRLASSGTSSSPIPRRAFEATPDTPPVDSDPTYPTFLLFPVQSGPVSDAASPLSRISTHIEAKDVYAIVSQGAPVRINRPDEATIPTKAYLLAGSPENSHFIAGLFDRNPNAQLRNAGRGAWIVHIVCPDPAKLPYEKDEKSKFRPAHVRDPAVFLLFFWCAPVPCAFRMRYLREAVPHVVNRLSKEVSEGGTAAEKGERIGATLMGHEILFELWGKAFAGLANTRPAPWPVMPNVDSTRNLNVDLGFWLLNTKKASATIAYVRAVAGKAGHGFGNFVAHSLDDPAKETTRAISGELDLDLDASSLSPATLELQRWIFFTRSRIDRESMQSIVDAKSDRIQGEAAIEAQNHFRKLLRDAEARIRDARDLFRRWKAGAISKERLTPWEAFIVSVLEASDPQPIYLRACLENIPESSKLRAQTEAAVKEADALQEAMKRENLDPKLAEERALWRLLRMGCVLPEERESIAKDLDPIPRLTAESVATCIRALVATFHIPALVGTPSLRPESLHYELTENAQEERPQTRILAFVGTSGSEAVVVGVRADPGNRQGAWTSDRRWWILAGDGTVTLEDVADGGTSSEGTPASTTPLPPTNLPRGITPTLLLRRVSTSSPASSAPHLFRNHPMPAPFHAGITPLQHALDLALCFLRTIDHPDMLAPETITHEELHQLRRSGDVAEFVGKHEEIRIGMALSDPAVGQLVAYWIANRGGVEATSEQDAPLYATIKDLPNFLRLPWLRPESWSSDPTLKKAFVAESFGEGHWYEPGEEQSEELQGEEGEAGEEQSEERGEAGEEQSDEQVEERREAGKEPAGASKSRQPIKAFPEEESSESVSVVWA